MPPSPFKIWRKSIPQLAKLQEQVDKLLGMELDAEAQFALKERMDVVLRLDEAVNKKVLAQTKLLKDLAEIKDLTMRELNDENLQELLKRFAYRRNMGTAEHFRRQYSKGLQALGWSKERADARALTMLPDMSANDGVPQLSPSAIAKRPLLKLDEQMEEGARELEALCEPDEKDGLPPTPQGQVTPASSEGSSAQGTGEEGDKTE